MSSNFRAATSVQGTVDGQGMRIGIVCGRFNDLITNRLLDGASNGLAVHGVSEQDVTVAWVPGAFEIPLAAKTMAASGRYDAVITLGAVIRGETAHFDYVAGPCANGIQDAQLETGVPIVFGVLTTENLEQALERSGERDNKGEEAARTAIEMVDVLRRLRGR
ncbi:MAG: 6,7-dimethyl-8-ribityllumazine synthase [Acidimicrobiales bacterium]|jgi:6,7-dimethyl-8-ribityllumazine synthase